MDRVRKALRQVADIAVEDFGLRGRAKPPARSRTGTPRSKSGSGDQNRSPKAEPRPEPLTKAGRAPVKASAMAPADNDLPPGVVWRGAAARTPALQRFVDDLDVRRSASAVR
jgi:hypothetical protein